VDREIVQDVLEVPELYAQDAIGVWAGSGTFYVIACGFLFLVGVWEGRGGEVPRARPTLEGGAGESPLFVIIVV